MVDIQRKLEQNFFSQTYSGRNNYLLDGWIYNFAQLQRNDPSLLVMVLWFKGEKNITPPLKKNKKKENRLNKGLK